MPTTCRKKAYKKRLTITKKRRMAFVHISFEMWTAKRTNPLGVTENRHRGSFGNR